MFSDLCFTSDDPLEIIERLADFRDWHFDRLGDDEMCLHIGGALTDYHLRLHWRHDIIAVHLSCFFGIKVPDLKHCAVRHLLCLINEHLFWGRFDLCSDRGSVLFCYGFPVDSDHAVRSYQFDHVIGRVVEMCTRYFPAFQYVLWSGYDAPSALEMCIFDVDGEA